MKFLEDAGFFCVDNLPVPLIEKFMELLTMPNNETLDRVLTTRYPRRRSAWTCAQSRPLGTR